MRAKNSPSIIEIDLNKTLRLLRHVAIVCLVLSIVAIQVFAKKNSISDSVHLQAEHEALFSQLRPYLGKCVINKFNKKYPKYNAFEETVAPYWSRQFNGNDFNNYVLSNVMLINDLRSEDIVAIDMMARTIYSEMDKGLDKGPHYARALAGVILNRAELFDKKLPGHKIFVPNAKNSDLKGSIAQVITAKKQFSAWNGVIGNKSNPVLPHALCPPAESGKIFWKQFAPQYKRLVGWKKLPSEKEVKHWEVAVRVSIEALLEQKTFWAHFKDNRKKVAGHDAFRVYYYTSGFYARGRHRGQRVTIASNGRSGAFKIVRGPVIGGRGDYDERLLRFWAPVKSL